MEAITDFITALSDLLWGWPMIIALVGCHLYLTIRLRFIQRYTFKAIRLSLKNDKGEGDVSPFGSLLTALAATIGTGNIIGVATAVALGGPGAIFWCWITGVLGIATKYSEALLAVHYRTTNKIGLMAGGPMYVLERGLNMKWLGILFAIFTSIAAFGIGNMVQANSISTLLSSSTGVPVEIIGTLMAILVAMVLLFGVKGIVRVCSLIVPFMAIVYVVGCVAILIVNHSFVGDAISLIVSSAFSGEAAGGGIAGGMVIMAIRFGVARGLFSNESGLGSAPIIAAAARCDNPVKQALISATGTFWDTVVVCALTGIVIVSSALAHPDISFSDGAILTQEAFSKIPLGEATLTIGLCFFAFSTILGWSYYGEKAMEYLAGTSFIRPYRVVWVIAVYIGCVMHISLVWSLSDCMNALMALPNIISLVLLSGVVVKLTRESLWKGNDNLFK